MRLYTCIYVYLYITWHTLAAYGAHMPSEMEVPTHTSLATGISHFEFLGISAVWFYSGGCTTCRHGCVDIVARFISTCQKPKAPWAILLILDVVAALRPTISRLVGRKKIFPARIVQFALVLSIFGLFTRYYPLTDSHQITRTSQV